MRVRRVVIAALFWLALTGVPAQAQSIDDLLPMIEVSEGAYPEYAEDEHDGRRSVREAARVRPMRDLGTDAFRFTFDASSALRKSYVFEARRSGAEATFVVTWLDRWHRGWRRTRRIQFHISLSDYEDLARSLDEELQRGGASSARIHAGEEPGVICVDGYALLTERIVGASQTWMRDSCGIYHPNEQIDRLLRDFVLDRLGS